jgi:hypothetical protein
MLSARSTAILIGAAVALATACTSTLTGDRDAATMTGERPASRGHTLLATTETGDVVIDAASGRLLAGGDGVVATPDGGIMFRADVAGDRTVVTTIDPRTGDDVASTDVRGGLELAIASVSGRALALVEPAPGAPEGSLPGRPMPRAETPIVVADPSGERRPMRFRLEGNYEPEAFSIDDDRLFLIQYLPAEAPAVYRVTVLDLATGEVRPVTGRFKTPPQRMPGVRLGQVYDPIRMQMYTLYSNRPGAYAQGFQHAGGETHEYPEETFVHVLNLRSGWAFCAGLPKAMWGGTAREQTLAPSPDGRWLYVVDASEGLVAVMHTKRLEVVRTARLALEPDADARTSLAVGRDGQTLYVASSAGAGSISAIDASTLTLTERWAVAQPISGLGLSLDGSALYAAGGGRIDLFDLGSGESFASVPTPGLEPVVGVEPLPFG